MAAPSPPVALLTVVIEDYFQVGSFSGFIPPAHWERFASRLMPGTEAVLECLARGGHRATFFARGWVAEHHPEVLRRVLAAGHEVACLSEASWLDAAPAQALAGLRRSRESLEQAIGQAVAGHRSGARWMRPQERQRLALVQEAGFAYDSSVSPLGARWAGDAAPRTLQAVELAGGRLIEVPVSSFACGPWRLPIAGGNWFRQAPDTLLRRAMRGWDERTRAPLVAYCHTWEFDDRQPRIAAASGWQRLRHYRRLDGLADRWQRWLDQRHSESIAVHLGWQARPVASQAVVAAAAQHPQGHRVAASAPPTSAHASPATALERAALTVVVPCFNEAETLPYLKHTLQAFVQRSAGALALSFVFVDDGSTDATWAGLQPLLHELPRCTLRRHPGNRGIGAALLTGFAAASTELVAVIDADCTFDPAQLPTLLARLSDDIDVVCASPVHAAGTMDQVPHWRSALSLSAAFLYRHVLHQRLSSYTSCFRLYRREALAGLALSDGGFSGVAEILGRLDLQGRRFAEVPAVLGTRVLGQSKIRVWHTIHGHFLVLARLAACRWLGRPLPAHVTAMTAIPAP